LVIRSLVGGHICGPLFVSCHEGLEREEEVIANVSGQYDMFSQNNDAKDWHRLCLATQTAI
jgi:hypothetical protein